MSDDQNKTLTDRAIAELIATALVWPVERCLAVVRLMNEQERRIACEVHEYQAELVHLMSSVRQRHALVRYQKELQEAAFEANEIRREAFRRERHRRSQRPLGGRT